MPVSLKKKPKASKNGSAALEQGALPVAALLSASGLDITNKSNRTPIMWIPDASPSMTGFTDVQFRAAESMVAELKHLPTTAQSVMFNIVQIGTPPVTTGFQEIAQFHVPVMHIPKSTPLHLALAQATAAFGSLFSDLRASGLDRTESVAIFTTDGNANDTTPEELEKSIQCFLDLGKKWSVTNIVVGVGSKLNEAVLKKLANTIPPLRIDELDAACLMPFIQNIARRVSESRRGQKIEIDLPDGLETIE